METLYLFPPIQSQSAYRVIRHCFQLLAIYSSSCTFLPGYDISGKYTAEFFCALTHFSFGWFFFHNWIQALIVFCATPMED